MHAFGRHAAVPRICENVQAAVLFTFHIRAEGGATNKILRPVDYGLKWGFKCSRNENPDGALCPRCQRPFETGRCQLQVDFCFCAQDYSSSRPRKIHHETGGVHLACSIQHPRPSMYGRHSDWPRHAADFRRGKGGVDGYWRIGRRFDNQVASRRGHGTKTGAIQKYRAARASERDSIQAGTRFVLARSSAVRTKTQRPVFAAIAGDVNLLGGIGGNGECRNLGTRKSESVQSRAEVRSLS